jgi:hypothetical protein
VVKGLGFTRLYQVVNVDAAIRNMVMQIPRTDSEITTDRVIGRSGDQVINPARIERSAIRTKPVVIDGGIRAVIATKEIKCQRTYRTRPPKGATSNKKRVGRGMEQCMGKRQRPSHRPALALRLALCAARAANAIFIAPQTRITNIFPVVQVVNLDRLAELEKRHYSGTLSGGVVIRTRPDQDLSDTN